MSQKKFYITTAIPYVNAQPHIGFALELVQTDVLARHRRMRGDAVRFLTGTDDNSLKNVQAAEAEGTSPQVFVDRNAAIFEALSGPLDTSPDDFIRTSSDPRHAPSVEALWRRSAEAGDLYVQHYEGLYCVGCEQFYQEDELIEGRCPEHGTIPQLVSEANWFFRLTRYEKRLRDVIASGELRIEPESRRNEVLGFIDGGLQDFSVSRSRERAHGWGVPVPDDPTQVMYVWYDALGNYISALGYGGDDAAYKDWWVGGDSRVHVIGKGIIRFHAVYWVAMLMSAGEPLPTDIFVHDYLTVDGKKIGKSLGNAIDPVSLVDEYGVDALRWWLVRDVPRVGDADFTVVRMVERSNDDLANGIGNLVNRVVSMVHKYRHGAVPHVDSSLPLGDIETSLTRSLNEVGVAIDNALGSFDIRRATGALMELEAAGNRYVESAQPWVLAKAERSGDASAAAQLDVVLAMLVRICRKIGEELAPFLPAASIRIRHQLGDGGDAVASAQAVFPRIELD